MQTTCYECERNGAVNGCQTCARLRREGRIARRLVMDALKAGYFVSIHDGEEWAVRCSGNREAIMGALASADSDTLRFYAAPGGVPSIGWVSLVWGNDTDIVSDHTDNEAMAALVKGAEAVADRLAR